MLTSRAPRLVLATVVGLVVEPGDYPLAAMLGTPPKITVHGVAGKPRPRLLFDGPNAAYLQVALGSSARYLELDQAPGAPTGVLVVRDESTADQVIAKGSGAPMTVQAENSTIRDSIVVATGPSGRAILVRASAAANTTTLRNVTAIASGSGGIAIQARAQFAAGNATVNLVNVIAGGSTGLESNTDSSGAYATILASHSNYQGASKVGTNAAVIGLAGNQGFPPPAFANLAAGDYRQALSSPTIGAGADDPANGAFDVDGDPRRIATTDIGADELVPAPAAGTGAASGVTTTAARLGGSVAAKGAPTTYRFQYGRTSAYGSATHVTAAGSGTGAVPAAATLSALRPATIYHYRLVATNAGGTASGADRTFTTAAAPAPFAGVRMLGRRLAYRHRSIGLELGCPAGTVGACAGRVKLTARKVRLGRASFAVAAGHQVTVELRVSRAGRRLLQRVHRLRATETSVARDGAGHTATTVAKVKIRRR